MNNKRIEAQNQTRIRAKTNGRSFSVEIPPVEWILEYDIYQVGKRKDDGSLVIVESFADSDGALGWVVHPRKNFQDVLKNDGSWNNDFLRALAHALGIEWLHWRHNIWLPVDDYLADFPHGEEQIRAYHERTAAHLDAAGRRKAAATYRRVVGFAKRGYA